MVRRPTCVCLLIALSGSTALAQTQLVVPASHTAIDGSSATNVPFGRSTPTRVQHAYDASLFPGPRTITAVSFRLDGGAAAAAKTVDCELRMSTLPVPIVNLAVDFASNRGADETVVLPRQLLTLAAGTAGGVPSPWLASIPLAVPFVHDPQQGGLLLEVIVHGQPPGAYSLDATFVCDSPEVTIGPASCIGTSGVPLRVESSTTQVIWGRPWVARVLDATPGMLVVLALGTTETGSWAGLTLPANLAQLGAPGCFVSIDLAGAWYSVAGGNGSAQFPFVVPNSPQVLGEWIRFQGAAFDTAANALGLVTSQARKVQVCGWEPVGRLWSNGITATTGTREIGLSAVVRLTVQ
ncbi:MAG: hypothetical protein MUC36_15720 [Planctomycetes bacterium]|jgi:hypothetical protein|nr:hypothetical protein [Planctomycetota bacterium]